MTTTAGRRAGGVLLAAAGLPGLVLVLTGPAHGASSETDLLLFVALVVALALVGGAVVAVPGALLAAGLVDYFFVSPRHTLHVADGDQVVALVVFVAVAAVVSALVELAARREAAGRQAAVLGALAERGIEGSATLADVLERARRTLDLHGVALTGARGPVATAGTVSADAPSAVEADAGDGLRLVGSGPDEVGRDQRVVRAFAAAARDAHAAEVAVAQQAADRLRDAILQAVGHDLRTPLAAIKAAAGTLRAPDLVLDATDRAELLETVDAGADQLDRLVTDLLDMSRLRADAVAALRRPVVVEDVVFAALAGLDATGRERVEVAAGDGLPLALADPVLLERVVANLLANAVRHAPGPIEVRGEAGDGEVRLLVCDHGPGLADAETAFAPFQRLGDRDAGGIGLGLAVARGFAEAMGGHVEPRPTPGGGATLVVTLEAAA